MFDSFDPLLNPNDTVMHQLLGDIIALNTDQNFSAMTPLSNGTTTNVNTNLIHTQTSDFIPQAPLPSNIFNPQMPSDFSKSASSCCSPKNDSSLSLRSNFAPGLHVDFSTLALQQFNTASYPQVHPGELGDDSDFSAVPTIPRNRIVNMDTVTVSTPCSKTNAVPIQGCFFFCSLAI